MAVGRALRPAARAARRRPRASGRRRSSAGRSCRGIELGGGHQQREAVAVDEAEAARRRASTSSAATPSGVLAPASRTENGVGERGAEVDAGRRVREQPVDRLDAELVVGELDDRHHDRVGAGVVAPGAARSSR